MTSSPWCLFPWMDLSCLWLPTPDNPTHLLPAAPASSLPPPAPLPAYLQCCSCPLGGRETGSGLFLCLQFTCAAPLPFPLVPYSPLFPLFDGEEDAVRLDTCLLCTTLDMPHTPPCRLPYFAYTFPHPYSILPPALLDGNCSTSMPPPPSPHPSHALAYPPMTVYNSASCTGAFPTPVGQAVPACPFCSSPPHTTMPWF